MVKVIISNLNHFFRTLVYWEIIRITKEKRNYIMLYVWEDLENQVFRNKFVCEKPFIYIDWKLS